MRKLQKLLKSFRTELMDDGHSEQDQIIEQYDHFTDDVVKLFAMPVVSVSLQREQLAKDILVALLQNPERYKYISEKVESGELKQEEANLKNINKAYKIADSFLSVGANER